jgi:uncharacterized protein YbjT (DUF2867 family)
MSETKKVLVLGASGLIGRFVTDELRSRGLQAVGVARSYSASQRTGAFDLELPLLALDSSALAQMIGDYGIDVVVNCVGLLQDVPGNRVGAVHRDFVARLLLAIEASGRAIRLAHISILGAATDDGTAFSATKREARIRATRWLAMTWLILSQRSHHLPRRPLAGIPRAVGG